MHKEWESEPNALKLECNGFKCLIIRNSMGVLCGYVALSKDHPYYGKTGSEIDLDVHGGITWNEIGDGYRGREEGYFWIGFDCAHSSDFIPSMPEYFATEENYRNIEYIESELIKLTEQLLPVNMAIRKMIGGE